MTPILRRSRLLSMLAVLMLAVSLLIPATAAPASTGYVLLADIDGLDGNVDADFWIVDYYDTNGRGDANDPTASIVAPPVTLSGYGTTALRLDSGAGTGGSGCTRLGGKPFFGTQALNGVRLSELTDLGYSYLVDSNSGIAGSENLTPYINIFVDKNGDGQWTGANDSILIYEPYYTLGAPTLDTWYDNLAIGTGATGRWHYAASALPGLGQFTPNTVDLWTEVIAQAVGGAGFDPAATTIGDLRIVNPAPGCSGSTQGGTGEEGTGSGLVITVGQKSGSPWNNYVGFIDAVILSSVGTVTINRIDDINVTGAAVTATIISGNNQSTPINTAFAPLVVEFRDINNALVDAGLTATVTAPGAGASATFAANSVTTDANGRATFDPTANGTVGGPYTVTVESGGASVDFSLTNTPPAPTAPVDLSATLNGVSQVDLAWTTTAVVAYGDQQEIQRSPAGAGTWSVVTTLPAADQTYTDSASCNVSLDYRIRVFNITDEAFSNTATIVIPPCAADIAVSAGNDQTADINTAYANPLVVLVVDGDSNPVAGISVTFIAPVAGASVTFPSGNTDVTDANGLASVDVTANGTAGLFNVVATTPDIVGDAAFFNLTNTLPITTTELLVNGNFNTDSGSPQVIPTGWIGRTLTKDAQRCNAAKSFDGPCYLVFTGNANERGRFIQEIDVTGLTAGQTLTFTASGNAKNGATGLIELLVTYPDSLRLPSNTSRSQLRWEANTSGYTTQSITHALSGTPTAVKVRIRSRALTGKWFVDGISLTVTSSPLPPAFRSAGE